MKTRTSQATYLASSHLERRLVNQTLFKRILVEGDSQILGTIRTPNYAPVAAWDGSLGQPPPKTDAQPAT